MSALYLSPNDNYWGGALFLEYLNCCPYSRLVGLTYLSTLAYSEYDFINLVKNNSHSCVPSYYSNLFLNICCFKNLI